ncbi:MAG: hypothetical protein RLZZ306_671 [Bacteroidota bacterium]|jgi:predicted dehydrogenase
MDKKNVKAHQQNSPFGGRGAINIAIVGTQFMGKAHSNAYSKVGDFFDLPAKPILKVACGVNEERLNQFATKFGWENTTTNWKKIINRDDIDLVDISTPNNSHAPIAIAAAKSGKHVICEKPIARNLKEARQMYDAAETAGITHAMIFNYRFVPAIAFAKKMISEGKIGKIHHFNAVYYQDWLIDPNFPMTWRHDVKASGSGAHGDMNAHIVDLARYLVGEFESVNGVEKVFVKNRPFANGSGIGTVTTDDSMSFFAHFQNGALGAFQCTRFANGRKNFLRLEIFGSEGSLSFNLERLNELEYFNRNEDADIQGFRNIIVTNSTHPYIGAWWPVGHIIGWVMFCKNRRGMGHGVNGAFARYAAIRPDQLYKIPEGVSMREASLVEPLAAAVHAVEDIAHFKLGDVALVSGPGPIGLLVVKLLARQGIKTIVAGTSDDQMRLNLSIKYGAYRTVIIDKENLQEIILEETNGLGADVAFEVAGVEASVRSCMEAIRPLGHFVQVGHFGRDLTLPWDLVAFRQLRIDGSVGYRRETWTQTMKILEQGFNVKDCITHEMSIADWKKGFDLMEAKQAVKILLNPI